jgi:ATP-dependent protease HslVU (ClpYQ) peptidase subunit
MTLAMKKETTSFKTLLSAAKKLTAEEKQLLRLQLFAADALSDMKAFEQQLKQKKTLIKKSDTAIVKLTKTIRDSKYAKAQKMLY